jgi:hypothetical protein
MFDHGGYENTWGAGRTETHVEECSRDHVRQCWVIEVLSDHQHCGSEH